MSKNIQDTDDIIYFDSFEELENKLYDYLQKIYNNQSKEEQSKEEPNKQEQSKQITKSPKIRHVKQIKPIKLGEQAINVEQIKKPEPISKSKLTSKLTSKENKIYELQHYKKMNNQEIESLKNKIDKLERLNKKIDDEIQEFSKKEPLEEFYDYIEDISLKYEIDLTNLIDQFHILYNELNKNNIQLNIDKVDDKFTLMIEGTEFSEDQKFQIQKLKKLFKSLNI